MADAKVPEAQNSLQQRLRGIFLGTRREVSPGEKHHESNLVWGPIAIGCSIVLTVVAAMKHDLRFLFFVAWPCFSFGAWHLFKRIPYTRLRYWITGISCVTVAGALWWLNLWLSPPRGDTTAGVTPQSLQLPQSEAKRLEFLARRNDRLRRIQFYVKLDRPYYPNEIGDFSLAAQVSFRKGYFLTTVAYSPSDNVAVMNGKPLASSQQLVWIMEGNNSHILQDLTLGWPHTNTSTPQTDYEVRGEELGGATLADMDGGAITLFVSKTLYDRFTYLAVVFDDYVILALPKRCVDGTTIYPFIPPEQPPKTKRGAEWQKPSLIRLVHRPFTPDGPTPPALAFLILFNDYTPLLVQDFNPINGSSLVIPPQFCKEEQP